MRLVCPKCVAQYEVAEQEIPEEGREVQCANCEHIWFQDRIVMFTEKRETAETPDNSVQTDDPELFEDLDGVGDVAFQRHHDGVAAPVGDLSDPEESESSADDIENILADDAEEFDEEPEYDDDPPMEMPEGGRPLTDDVLDVLRKEAEFSSNRAETEVEAEAADSPVPSEDEEEHVLEEPLETDLDELTAFLSSYETDSTESEPEEEETPDVAESPEEPSDSQDPVFDPLSDLDAIRSQLDSIREDPADTIEEESPVEVSYTPVLPQDDTLSDEDFTLDIEIPDLDAATASAQAVQEQEEPEETADVPVEFDLDDFAQVLDSPETQSDTPDAIPFDDFEESRPRQAFRADMATDEPLEDTPPEETFFAATDDSIPSPEEPAAENDSSAIPAAMALGNMRPRASKSPRRIRTIAEPEDLIATTPEEPANDPADGLSRPVRPVKSNSSERPERPTKTPDKPATSRKELLPDVEELDSTLRGEAPKVQAEQAIMDSDAAPASKSFGRAFVWTLLILAILIALYVMRPMIVAALPASGVVLNPYGNFIDSIRLMIESLIG